MQTTLREALRMLESGEATSLSYGGWIIYAGDMADSATVALDAPITEVVEVTRWAAMDDSGAIHCIQGSRSFVESYIDQLGARDSLEIVELTGSYQRVVPPKRKRREELHITSIAGRSIKAERNTDDDISGIVRVFAEWLE